MNFGLSVRFFMFGIKEVLFENKCCRRFDLLIKNYPYLTKEQFPALKDSYLFFQDHESMSRVYEEYIRPNIHIKRPSQEFDRLIGTVLGYPPRAVEFYSSGRSQQQPDRAIGLRFCGVECVGCVDDIVEDVQWLWKRYPYPDADVLSMCYKREYVEVEYGDVEKLRELQANLIEHINTIKS